MNKNGNRFDHLTCVRVRPNHFNLILVPDNDSDNDENISGNGDKSKSLDAHMNPKIVRLARQVIDERMLDDEDVCDMDQLNERITKIENMLTCIVDKLNNLNQK